MTASTTVEPEGLIDERRLSAWLDEHLPALGDGPLDWRMIHGGTSNVIVSICRGGPTVVLRRPPAVPPPNSERAIMREARVLHALNDTPVPHPQCRAICEDSSVLGAQFYVMELISGWAGQLRDGHIYHHPPFDMPPYEYGVQYALVDGIVALANVDYRAVGLVDYGKPDNFLERQVDRWAGQLRSYERMYGYAGRELQGYALTEAWLRANVPKSSVSGIIHGDVGTPNALFDYAAPARLKALIDWELSTIGDPLLDLGWLCSQLRDERDPGRTIGNPLYNVDNMPTRQELARYYAAGTGRDVSSFDYYLILALFKAGCLLEYKVAQAAAGMLPRATGDFFSRLVADNFLEAEHLIRRFG